MQKICIIRETNWGDRLFFMRRGILADSIPMIKTEIYKHVLLNSVQYNSLCLTSKVALDWLLMQTGVTNKNTLVFCLSKAQAKILKTIGIATIYPSEPTSAALAHLINSYNNKGKTVFLAGNRSLFPFYANDIEKLEVYKTILSPKKIDTELYDAFVFYSPSGVEAFAQKNPYIKNSTCFAIGNTTARTLKQYFKVPVYSSNKQQNDLYFRFVAKTLKIKHYGISV